MINKILELSLKGGSRCRLSIIDYHRITLENDPYVDSSTQAELDWQCSILSKHFNVIPLKQAVELLQKGQIPPRSVVMTFDDGYANNHTLALPILKKWDLPATFFIASGFIDGGIMWNDSVIEAIRRTEYESIELFESDGFPTEFAGNYDLSTQQKRISIANKIRLGVKYIELSERKELVAKLAEIAGVELPQDMMLSSAQVKDIVTSGMDVGGHTCSHPILATLRLSEAKQQIEDDKAKLQQITGAPVEFFAYPNGKPDKDYFAAHATIVKEAGYLGAVSTAHGVSTSASDIYQLPRFSPWDKTTLRYLYRMFVNGLGCYS